MMMTFWQRITRDLKKRTETRRVRVVIALIQQLFIILLGTYLLLLLLETIFHESVSRFLNLNYLLLVVIASGIVSVLTLKNKGANKETARPVTRYNIITLICLSLGGAALIWYQTQEIGWFSYLVSMAGGGLIVLLSLFIWKRDSEGESEGEDSQDK